VVKVALLVFFALHGQQYIPVVLKTGMVQNTMGALCSAKFGPYWGKETHKAENLIKIRVSVILNS